MGRWARTCCSGRTLAAVAGGRSPRSPGSAMSRPLSPRGRTCTAAVGPGGRLWIRSVCRPAVRHRPLRRLFSPAPCWAAQHRVSRSAIVASARERGRPPAGGRDATRGTTTIQAPPQNKSICAPEPARAAGMKQCLERAICARAMLGGVCKRTPRPGSQMWPASPAAQGGRCVFRDGAVAAAAVRSWMMAQRVREAAPLAVHRRKMPHRRRPRRCGRGPAARRRAHASQRIAWAPMAAAAATTRALAPNP
jgi:hypothetical protein